MDGPIVTKGILAWFEACLAAIGHPQSGRVLLGSSADLADVPPAYVLTAGFDPLKDEGRDFAARLRAVGVAAEHVDHPSMIHDFLTMPDVSDEVVRAIEGAARALRDGLAQRP